MTAMKTNGQRKLLKMILLILGVLLPMCLHFLVLESIV